MHLEAISQQLAYNRWATGLIMDAAGKLSTEQFVAPDDTPFGSVRNELVHLLDTQQSWIEIAQASIKGVARAPTYPVPEEFPDIDSVAQLWDSVESSTDEFMASISEDDLQTIILARFDWGDLSSPLWGTLVHIVIHGTQHRSEVAMKLTNFGHSPGMLDFFFYWEAMKV